MTLEPD